MWSQVSSRKHYTNEASGGNGIPAELFQILRDDAVKVLHSICQKIWKTQQWPREGNGAPLQYSCLENPMDGGAWWEAVDGIAQSRTRLKRLSSSSNNAQCTADPQSVVTIIRKLNLREVSSWPGYRLLLWRSHCSLCLRCGHYISCYIFHLDIFIFKLFSVDAIKEPLWISWKAWERQYIIDSHSWWFVKSCYKVPSSKYSW